MTHDPIAPIAEQLSHSQTARYSRHLLLPEIGLDGQRRLAAARVMVVGAGGLGAPVLLYLAAAGIGSITVIDDDVVEVSNLQRQVIHRDADIGVAKVDSAARAVRELNPDVHIDVLRGRLEEGNALTLFADHDVVVDTTDNFATRYLVADACVLLGLPLVWASIHRFDGQATVWWSGVGPCYRCVFPTPPAPGTIPSCSQAGVLGSIPGVMGSIQATETVKLLLGIGEPLVGRMLVHDALAGTWSTIAMRPDPDCPICGEHPSITTLRQDLISCAAPPEPVQTISPRELHARLHQGGAGLRLIDVRTAQERDISTIEPSESIPLDALTAERLSRFDGTAQVVFYCRSGARSADAARAYRAATGRTALSLDGGVLAWARDVDPQLVVY